MIEVVNLEKKYDAKLALDRLSFEVRKGEVAGFIGPNGAGKSTTMRILASFLQPSSGVAKVAGYDCFLQSMEVRKRIGYLPEAIPLYTEMKVEDYLLFRGSLKGLKGKELKKCLEYVVEKCSLKEYRNEFISTLSKGYRQRVGIADVLIHHPLVLILDEPLVGLDPKQLIDLRNFIIDLASDHTILLSSHLLHQVESVCKRIIIIDEGKIIAQGNIDNFSSKLSEENQIALKIRSEDSDQVYMSLSSLDDVDKVESLERSRDYADFLVYSKKNLETREIIFDLAVENQWKILEMKRNSSNLENIYLKITGGLGQKQN